MVCSRAAVGVAPRRTRRFPAAKGAAIGARSRGASRQVRTPIEGLAAGRRSQRPASPLRQEEAPGRNAGAVWAETGRVRQTMARKTVSGPQAVAAKIIAGRQTVASKAVARRQAVASETFYGSKALAAETRSRQVAWQAEARRKTLAEQQSIQAVERRREILPDEMAEEKAPHAERRTRRRLRSNGDRRR